MFDLLEYKHEKVDLFYTKEAIHTKKVNPSALEGTIDRTLWELEDNALEIMKVCKKYGQLNKLEGTAMLHAHGHSKNKKWCFEVDGNMNPVQDWINKLDGQYNLLFLSCCNPDGNKIKSEKSLVLVPNGKFSLLDYNFGGVKVELYIPDIGYTNDYIIDSILESLNKKLSS